MTQDEARKLQAGDRVVIQRRGHPAPHYGTVRTVSIMVMIDWEPCEFRGEEYGGAESIFTDAMGRISRA